MKRAVAGDQKIVVHREVGDQFRVLKHPADAMAGHGRRGHRRENHSVELDAAAGRPRDAGDAVEQRAFAGAVRADQPDDRAGLQRKGNVAQGVDAAEVHRHVFDGEIRHLRNLRPRRRIIPHSPCGMNTMTTTSSRPNTRPGASLMPRSSSGTIT